MLAVALLLIVVRLAGIAADTMVSPLRGHDVWAHWATKTRVWLETGTLSRFVSAETWLARGDPSLYTDANPGHPGTVPLLQVWTGLFLRDWSESLINFPGSRWRSRWRAPSTRRLAWPAPRRLSRPSPRGSSCRCRFSAGTSRRPAPPTCSSPPRWAWPRWRPGAGRARAIGAWRRSPGLRRRPPR